MSNDNTSSDACLPTYKEASERNAHVVKLDISKDSVPSARMITTRRGAEYKFNRSSTKPNYRKRM